MFTGIVTALGTIQRFERQGRGATLTVACPFEALEIGESIAVDGVCLTVTRDAGGAFEAGLGFETLARTTLGTCSVGRPVNLERAMRPTDRLGGHLVSGHVDGLGTVQSREKVQDAERWRVAMPRDLARFVAAQGSITVDGVSLTVTDVDDASFGLMLVPHTMSVTVLGRRRPGDAVNLEVDVLARYVARLLGKDAGSVHTGGVTASLLERAGFTGEDGS